jgi:hypothetical protein
MHDRLARRPMPRGQSISVIWKPAGERCLHKC